jgi:MFS family permease
MKPAPDNQYRWTIAVVAVLIYFFTNGMAIFVPQNLFPRLMEDFSVTSAVISRSAGITLLAAAFMAPFAGALIDRFGVIRIIRVGLVVMLICFISYPFAGSIEQLYVIHAGLALGLVCSGLMPNVVLITAWFQKGRGSMIGILAAGSSLAGAVLPLAISPLVLNPDYGWRWGMGALAIAFFFFAFVPGFLLLKPAPTPDSDADTTVPADGVELRTAMRSITLWALALGSACLWFSIQSMNSQVTIFFEQEAALTPQRATLLFSLIFWCSFFGMQIASCILFMGCLLLFNYSGGELSLTTDGLRLTLFAAVFGLGFGGCFTMIQLVAVESFGQRSLGKILGFIVFIDSTGAALGTVLIGQLRTSTGDYLVPFLVVTAVAATAILAVSLIKPVTSSADLSANR